MILFEGLPGRVVQLTEAAVQGRVGLVEIVDQQEGDDAGIDFLNQRSIITRLTIAQEVNVQFLHTLGAHIYVYVFGDRIGEITLSGLSFAQDCDQPGSSDHGAERMLQWYRSNRASVRSEPLRVLVGETAIEGFNVGSTLDVADPSTTLVQWGLTLKTLPDP